MHVRKADSLEDLAYERQSKTFLWKRIERRTYKMYFCKITTMKLEEFEECANWEERTHVM